MGASQNRKPRTNPLLLANARQLRKQMTPAEKILWKRLRGRHFADFKFRRQYPIGRFIADFYCHEAGVIVEVDGQTHIGNEAKDKRRADWLKANGFCVLQIWNSHVYDELNAVLEMIWNECNTRTRTAPAGSGRSSPLSPRERGRG